MKVYQTLICEHNLSIQENYYANLLNVILFREKNFKRGHFIKLLNRFNLIDLISLNRFIL